jgi:AhpD family alkylhydroperoxidase
LSLGESKSKIMERISQKEAAGVYQAMYQVQQYVDQSGIDKKLMILLKFRVSQINSCAYCIDMHFKEGIHAGETPLRLISAGVWRETPYYTPEERAVLAFAEVLTHLPPEENSDTIHDELSKYFSKEQIAHLTLAIVMINSWNRLVRSFGPVPGKYKVQEAMAN